MTCVINDVKSQKKKQTNKNKIGDVPNIFTHVHR